ncbi:MAG: hypothetical protein ACK2T6_01400 [Anaerolineae bacterium]
MAWAPFDGFENPAWPDPGLWSLPNEPAATWWPSGCQARSGERALRAFGAGRGDVELPCDAQVEEGAASTITMRLDLRNTSLATRIDLFFDLWLMLPQGDDQGLFVHLLVPIEDGGYESVPVFGATGSAGQWAFPSRMLDLMNLTDIVSPGQPIDLRGDVWYLVWTAYAPHGAPPGGGIYIDNVSLVWEPDPAVPTPTPWLTATPTASATSTATSTATRTATPTATPTPILLFVPRVLKEPPPTPTATPPATPTPTTDETAVATSTAGAMPGETVEPTEPTESATPAETAQPTDGATTTPTGTATAGPTEESTAVATNGASPTRPLVETLPPATRTPTPEPTPLE